MRYIWATLFTQISNFQYFCILSRDSWNISLAVTTNWKVTLNPLSRSPNAPPHGPCRSLVLQIPWFNLASLGSFSSFGLFPYGSVQRSDYDVNSESVGGRSPTEARSRVLARQGWVTAPDKRNRLASCEKNTSLLCVKWKHAGLICWDGVNDGEVGLLFSDGESV